MKKRIVVLFVCLFALTPALMGSAWAIEGEKYGDHPIFDTSRDCELLRAKRLATKSSERAIRDVRASSVQSSVRATGSQAF